MMNVRYRHVHRDVGHVDGTTDLPPLEVVNLAVACPLFLFRFGSSWCFMTSLETLVHRRRRMDSRSVICQEVGRKWTRHCRPQMPTRGVVFGFQLDLQVPPGGLTWALLNGDEMKNEQNCCLFPFDIGSSCLMAQSWQTRMELKNKRSERRPQSITRRLETSLTDLPPLLSSTAIQRLASFKGRNSFIFLPQLPFIPCEKKNVAEFFFSMNGLNNIRLNR